LALPSMQTELEHDAGFRNFYEDTKYLAELEVEQLRSELPVTIFRPSVVAGDSETGETTKYDGIYYLSRYLLKWPSVLSAFNIGNSVVTLNLVPVDFVVEAMASLVREPLSVGKTLQLADPADRLGLQGLMTIEYSPQWLIRKQFKRF